MEFAKGYESASGLILVLDMSAALPLQPAAVATLCSPQHGVGADGLLRVTVAGSAREAGVFDDLPPGVTLDDWYMDSRRSDGSIARQCSDGFRLFAQFLWETGLERRRQFVIGSPCGARLVDVNAISGARADITVDIGTPTSVPVVTANVRGRSLPGVLIGDDQSYFAYVDPTLSETDLAAMDLDSAPDTAQLSADTTWAVLTAPVDEALTMRTMGGHLGDSASAETVAQAAAYAGLQHRQIDTGTLLVRGPHCERTVTVTPHTTMIRGSSTLVATGKIASDWWNGRESCSQR